MLLIYFVATFGDNKTFGCDTVSSFLDFTDLALFASHLLDLILHLLHLLHLFDLLLQCSSHTSLSPVFQTAYMPNRHRLFCFLPNFKIKNSSETVIRLLRRLGYLKRRIQIFSFMKKKKCSFSLFFTPLFLGFFHIYI